MEACLITWTISRLGCDVGRIATAWWRLTPAPARPGLARFRRLQDFRSAVELRETGRGVPAGATIPCHTVISYPFSPIR